MFEISSLNFMEQQRKGNYNNAIGSHIVLSELSPTATFYSSACLVLYRSIIRTKRLSFHTWPSVMVYCCKLRRMLSVVNKLSTDSRTLFTTLQYHSAGTLLSTWIIAAYGHGHLAVF